MTGATSQEQLAELVDLCRAGKLFEAQAWIAQGKPVGYVPDVKVKGTTRTPMRVAMERGFHSLVQVLLDAGAELGYGRYSALADAVGMRRPDLATLLIQHGARVKDVSMADVLESWHPEMVELFLANGASLVDGRPVACALFHKMRPVLGLLKRFADDPAVIAQGEMALRYHADQGNMKWVSLLLWAGVSPWARGPYWPGDLDVSEEEQEEDDGLSALELAARNGKLDVLKLKGMLRAMAADREATNGLLRHACYAPDGEVLSWLLGRGHRPDTLADRGTAGIDSLLWWMSWDAPSVYPLSWADDCRRSGIDSSRGRERLRMLHLLVSHGAKWLPADKQSIGSARRSLLKLAPDFLLEVAWLMQTYRAARRSDMEELIRTQSVARLLGNNLDKLRQIVAATPADPLAGAEAGGR